MGYKLKTEQTASQHARWREKLKVASAINVLNQAVEGKIELSPSRVQAIKIVLNKSLPDLTSVEINGGTEPIKFTWAPAIKAEHSTVIDVTPTIVTPTIPGKTQGNQYVRDKGKVGGGDDDIDIVDQPTVDIKTVV